MVISKLIRWLRPKFTIMFEVTNACNLRCPFCYVLREGRMKNEFIPLNRYENILKTYRPLYFQMTGGEAPLHPKFIELIKIASKYSFRTQISSNGLILRKYIDQLYDLPKKFSFGIDLDAPNEIHDTIRQKKGLFKEIMRTILRLKEAGIQQSLHVIIFGKNDLPYFPEGNLDTVEDMLSFCQEFQLNANFQPHSPTQKATRVALGKILLKSKSRYIINSIPYRKMLINGNWGPCRYNWTAITFGAQGRPLPTEKGNCYLCHDCSKCYFSNAWEPSLFTSRHFLRTFNSFIKPVLSSIYYKSN